MTDILCANCEDSIPEDDAILFVVDNSDDAMICDSCAEGIRRDIDALSSCDNCSETIATYGEMIGSGNLGYTFTYYDVEFSIGDDTFSISNGYTYDNGSWCESCDADNTSCDECGDRVSDSRVNYCEECDLSFCESCEENHDGCGREMSSGMSISDALARPAIKGNVIRSTRAVGVELERDGGNNAGTAARLLMEAGLLYESHGEHCGHEFVLLPMRGANLENGLREAFRILSDEGWTGNRDCGAHFHIDCSTLTPAEMLRGIAALRIVESVLFAGTGEEDDARRGIGFRRTLNWCAPTAQTHGASVREVLRIAEAQETAARASSRGASSTFARFSVYDAVGQTTRYSAINTMAYAEHRTIEVRLMDGALDVDRFLAVIGIALAAFEYGLQTTTGTLAALIGQPLSLLYRAAQAGFVNGPASEYLQERYGKVSAEIRAAERIAARRAELEARRREISARRRAAQNAATDVYNRAVAAQQERENREIAAAESMVRAAAAAYEAARQASYRLQDMARAAFLADPIVAAANAERMAAQAAAQAAADSESTALYAEETALAQEEYATRNAGRTSAPSCGVIGCRTCR